MENQDKIIDKIKKLLRLSNSPNENEASLAYERAHELMLKYQVSIDISDLNCEVCEIVFEEGSGPLRTWKNILAHTVAKDNGCTLLHKTGGGSYKIMIIGNSLNIDLCKETYQYLIKSIERISKDFKGKSISYKLGIAVNICQRIKAQVINKKTFSEQEEKALVILKTKEEQENKKFLSKHHPRLIETKSKISMNQNAYSQGIQDGNSIGLHKQVR